MNKFNKFTNITKKTLYNWGLFVLLIIILIIITYYRVRIQTYVGPPYDTFDFLANAAEFAGKSIGYSDPRPPFLSFLTSIVFRFEGLSESLIFYIDGLIYILGAIGMYLFLKLRFNSIISFLGALIYATFPIILTYVGVGFPDLSSVSFSIWALYLTVLAVKRNSIYFFLSFPLFMISFLTKFDQGLIIFPIFLLIIINWQNIRNHRNIFIGILLSFLIVIPFLIFFYWKYGNPLALFMDFYGISTDPVTNLHFDYNPDSLFYLKYIPLVIGNGALISIAVIMIGIFLGWSRLIRKGITAFHIKTDIKRIKTKLLVVGLFTLIFLLSLGSIPYLVSEVLFFVLCVTYYKLFKIDQNLDLDLLFFSWFLVFLIFHSIFLVKDIRYFLALMPSIAYFLVRGLVLVENQFGLVKNKKLTFYLTPVLIVVILLSTFFYLPSLFIANHNNTVDKDMDTASKWLISYDSGYKSMVIYSDLWAISAWYLQVDVKKMPRFKNGTAYYYSMKDYNLFTKEDIDYMDNELVKNHADYYFCISPGLNLTNYKIIKKFGVVAIYQRI